MPAPEARPGRCRARSRRGGWRRRPCPVSQKCSRRRSDDLVRVQVIGGALTAGHVRRRSRSGRRRPASAVFSSLLGQGLVPEEALPRRGRRAPGSPFRKGSLSGVHADGAAVRAGEVHLDPALGRDARRVGDLRQPGAGLSNTWPCYVLGSVRSCRLFNVPPDRVQVVVHPQSTIHSLVEFVDGSILAQISVTDMRLPILYALTYPERIPSDLRFSIRDLRHLDFCPPEMSKFPCLALAYEAAAIGGANTIALNAADEIAVAAFLEEQIGFEDIPRIIAEVIAATPGAQLESIQEVLSLDTKARLLASEMVKRHSRKGSPVRAISQ